MWCGKLGDSKRMIVAVATEEASCIVEGVEDYRKATLIRTHDLAVAPCVEELGGPFLAEDRAFALSHARPGCDGQGNVGGYQTAYRILRTRLDSGVRIDT